MKMVVAYVERDRADPIREELLKLGFLSLSILDASGSFPEPEVAGRYRGVEIEQHTRPKSRLECVAGDDQASIAIESILEHGGERTFAFAVPVEQVSQSETVKADEAPVQAG